MEVQSVDQILTRIERAAAARPGGAIAFDGDGTLWSGDVGEDFFLGVLERFEIRSPALEALAAEARAAGLSAEGTGVEIARRIYDAYMKKSFDEERVCEIMTWICGGFSRAEIDAFCIELLKARALASRLHAEVQAVVKWAGERGITAYLVSASPASIVEAASDVAKIPRSHVVAARAEYLADAEGTMGAAVHRPIPYGPGKVTRLRERLKDLPLYAAFGDNAFDVPMLREAMVPVAVRPKPRLAERAHDVPGLVIIAQ